MGSGGRCMMEIKVDNFSEHKDERGSLIVVTTATFPIKRIFYVTGAPINMVRGRHAHTDTQQYYFCMKGKIEITLWDGMSQPVIVLLKEKRGIFIDKLIWSSEKFLTGNDQLVVLCSAEYKQDYIRTKEEFEEMVRKSK